MLLEGRTAVVTGSSSGIGRAIAIEFALEGANVAVLDLQEDPKRGIYHEKYVTTTTSNEIKGLGKNAAFFQVDVSSEKEVCETIQKVVDHFHSIDIMVNNAGVHLPGSIETMETDEWDQLLSVNLRAAFVGIKSVIPHLRKSQFGRIIQIASVHAYGGGLGPAYPASKAGVTNLIKDAAIELGKYGITANAICPGYIETAIQDYLTSDQISACLNDIPLARLGVPKDVARAAVFLASDDAEWISGSTLIVDGGQLAAT